jgi:hypothetical protein
MLTICTYDIPQKHVLVKQELFSLGYSDKFVSQNKYVYLPNTTVYHATKTTTQTRSDVQSACYKHGVNLERCIAVRSEDWAAIFGEPFK